MDFSSLVNIDKIKNLLDLEENFRNSHEILVIFNEFFLEKNIQKIS